MKTKKPKSIRNVFTELAKLHVQVQKNPATVSQVAASANVLGKMLTAARTQLTSTKVTGQPLSRDWKKIFSVNAGT